MPLPPQHQLQYQLQQQLQYQQLQQQHYQQQQQIQYGVDCGSTTTSGDCGTTTSGDGGASSSGGDGGGGNSTGSNGHDEELRQIKNEVRKLSTLQQQEQQEQQPFKSSSSSTGSLSPKLSSDSQKKMAAIPPDAAKQVPVGVPDDGVEVVDVEATTTPNNDDNNNNDDETKKKDKKKKKKKKKNRECLICQRTTLECKMRMRKLTCGHHFCSSCIDRWLSTKDTCPYCRQQVKKALARQRSFGAVTA
eukprot:Sro120_g058530.1 finger protein (247) ;mRNA; f:66780-67520